jgi:radical SAM superfamily enzyme YgiQ (UPF0313 family)
LLELVNHLGNGCAKLSEIKGLAYKENGTIVVNPRRSFLTNLDELPDPAWHLVDVTRYREVTICTSRGCPRNCTFCSNSAFYEGHVGDLSAEKIVTQMEKLHKRYGVNFFWFAGENFAFKTKRLKQFSSLIKQRKLNVKWNCEISAIPSEENIKLMAESGCVSVYMMVESGSPRIIQFLRKKYTVGDLERVFWIFVKNKIIPTPFMMCGLPTETLDDYQKSEDLIHRLDNPPYLNAKFVPYPGSYLFDYCVSRKLIDPPQKLSEWPKFAEKCATQINLSSVPDTIVYEAMANFGKTVAARRARFAIRHDPSYFLKIFKNPVGFLRDLKSLRKYYSFMLKPKPTRKEIKLREYWGRA